MFVIHTVVSDLCSIPTVCIAILLRTFPNRLLIPLDLPNLLDDSRDLLLAQFSNSNEFSSLTFCLFSRFCMNSLHRSGMYFRNCINHTFLYNGQSEY